MTIVRRGSINAAGQVEASRAGFTRDFNLSLEFGGSANCTILLQRRFDEGGLETVSNEGDRLLTLAGDSLVTLQGDGLFTLGETVSTDDGFRTVDSFTASGEYIVEVVSPTEFQLKCDPYTAGPVEYRLG